MNKIVRYFLFFIIVSIAIPAEAQLKDKAKEVMRVFEATKAKNDSIQVDTISVEGRRRLDSIRLKDMALQIQELKLNEILLISELDQVHSGVAADSIKRAAQRQRIDSLRSVSLGVPIMIDSDTLFVLFAQKGGLTASKRAENIQNTILEIGKEYSLKADSIYVIDGEFFSDIMYGDRVVMSVTDQDGLWMNVPRNELAHSYVPLITKEINKLKEEYGLMQMVKRIALFITVFIVEFFLWRGTSFLFRKLRRRIVWLVHNKLKPIAIRDYEFLDAYKQARLLLFFSKIFQYVIILLQLIIVIPILFAIFPQTENIAVQLFSYIFDPVKMIFKSVIGYIPNLFIITIIFLCIKYLVKFIQYISNEIESERLKITGFYPDWAQPTFNIIRFLLYVFMIAMIYPYLPGSKSGVFQGISIFVGLIVSLGSSSAIANIVAGLVITYMRPFKLGDRIKLGLTEGHVIEKTPFVTRIKTPKNEIITMPNSSIMSSNTINYSESAKIYGLIIYSSVSFNYDVPWQKAHEILISAAKNTPRISSTPEPFVLEEKLDNSYVIYQINAYVKNPDRLPQIYSDLHQQIIDKSKEAGVDLLSPLAVSQHN